MLPLSQYQSVQCLTTSSRSQCHVAADLHFQQRRIVRLGSVTEGLVFVIEPLEFTVRLDLIYSICVKYSSCFRWLTSVISTEFVILKLSESVLFTQCWARLGSTGNTWLHPAGY
jgi:hypothetical protein